MKFAKDWGNASTEGLKSYGLGLAIAVRNELLNQTARPIYFIAHSLGGLVVEQALLESTGSDASLHNIHIWTAGILFFGVPHQGSHLAKWGSALRKLIPQSIRSTNKKVIDALKSDSEVCQNLDGDFQKEAKHGKFKNIRLFSFYETQKLPGFSNLVVPEKSAVLKADFKCAIEGDHKSMTRFTGPNDPEYCKVKGQLTYWLLPENTTWQKMCQKRRKRVGLLSMCKGLRLAELSMDLLMRRQILQKEISLLHRALIVRSISPRLGEQGIRIVRMSMVSLLPVEVRLIRMTMMMWMRRCMLKLGNGGSVDGQKLLSFAGNFYLLLIVFSF